MSQTRVALDRRFEFRVFDLFRISDFDIRISAERLALLLVTSALFLYGLGDRDLNSSHEARAAQNAQMVLAHGNWLLPRLYDGHLELQKPPLYYWLVAILGMPSSTVGPWAVRLPAALSALGCVLFIHLLGCRVGRPRAGFLAALALATCVYFTWMARVGRIDMPLTLALTVAMGSFHIARTAPPGRRWFCVGFTALGAGVLLKGPIALALAAVVWLTQGRAAWRSVPWWGLPWTLVIAAPWFIWANIETGGRLWEVFFWVHNVERGLGGADMVKAHPWWFYGPACAIDLLPWSIALPLLAWAWLRRPDLRGDPLARLGAGWLVAMLVFLSCMSFKRADYLLPAYPGFALLLGAAAERFAIRGRVFAVAVLGAVLGWGSFNTWIAPRQEDGWPYQQIAREIRATTDRPVIFFRAECHVLAFHVGPPLDTILEWENLQWWVDRPFPVYVVMPEAEAREWAEHLGHGRLEAVLRTRDRLRGRREHAVVVMRSIPRAG